MPDPDPTDLLSAARQLVERPLAEPTPLPELQDRARRIVQRRRRAGATLTVVALLLLVAGITTVAAQTGGTKRVSSATGALATTTTTAGASASATTIAGSTAQTSVAAGASATTVASGSAATTARNTTATTAKKSSITAVSPTANKAVSGAISQTPAGGITNVRAPATQPSADVQPGGAMTMVQALDIASFDPVALTGSVVTDGVAPSAVFDLLLYVDPATGVIVPQTADSLTSSDGVTWTLKLRQGVKFTDGSPYDAGAVKFNWERLQNDSRAIRGPVVNQIQSLTAVDPTTLRITLRSKNVLFPASAALVPYIASPTALQAKGAGFAADPVGAGPYVLKSWDRNSQMTLLRSPTYWNAPRPYLDQLVLKPIADEAQRINALANGQASVVSITSPQSADQAGRTPNTNGYPVLLNGGLAVWFNTKKAPFNDVRARRAIAMAIDPKDYAKVVDGGMVAPIDSAFRPESPFYDASGVQPAYDPAGAQQLFDQLASERGASLTFTMTAASLPAQQAAAQYIQSALNRYANVKMTVQTEALAQHTASCSSGSYDGACVMANAFTDPEPAWTGLYTCAVSPSPTGWCNSQFDRAVADNQQTSDAKQRVTDVKDAQKQLVAEVPALYVERGYTWVFTASTVHDVAFAADGIPLFDRLWLAGRSGGGTTTTTAPPSTTTTTRPVTTVPTTAPPTTTTAKPVTTTAAKPVTTTTVKPATTVPTSATATTPSTAVPTTSTELATTTTTTPANPDVALSPTSASQTKRVSAGMLALLVLLAVVFGVTSCAAFFLWRQQRAGTWWE